MGNRTRLQAFPGLEKSGRAWEPKNFCPERAYKFLSKKVLTRKVSPSGHITHFGQPVSVFPQLKRQMVQVKLNAQSLEWEVYHDYKLVKKYSALPQLSQERLQNLTIFQ